MLESYPSLFQFYITHTDHRGTFFNDFFFAHLILVSFMQNTIYIKRNIPVLEWAHCSVAAAKSEQSLVFKSKPALWLCLVCCDIYMRSGYILSHTCCVSPVLSNSLVLHTNKILMQTVVLTDIKGTKRCV